MLGMDLAMLASAVLLWLASGQLLLGAAYTTETLTPTLLTGIAKGRGSPYQSLGMHQPSPLQR